MVVIVIVIQFVVTEGIEMIFIGNLVVIMRMVVIVVVVSVLIMF